LSSSGVKRRGRFIGATLPAKGKARANCSEQETRSKCGGKRVPAKEGTVSGGRFQDVWTCDPVRKFARMGNSGGESRGVHWVPLGLQSEADHSGFFRKGGRERREGGGSLGRAADYEKKPAGQKRSHVGREEVGKTIAVGARGKKRPRIAVEKKVTRPPSCFAGGLYAEGKRAGNHHPEKASFHRLYCAVNPEKGKSLDSFSQGR